MKILLLFLLSAMLLCCGDNTVAPVKGPSDTQAALSGNWMIEIESIDTTNAGFDEREILHVNNIRLGKYEAKSTFSIINDKKVVKWEGQVLPYQFFASFDRDFFLGGAMETHSDKSISQSLFGVFYDYDNWRGFREYHRSQKENNVTNRYSFKVTFKAKRKL